MRAGPQVTTRLPEAWFGAPLTLGAWLRFDAIRRAIRETRPGRIVEIGAGGGAMATRLAQVAGYVGFEPDASSYELAAARLGQVPAAHLVNGEADAGATGGDADLLCAFEVLEHIADDVAALRAWSGHLRRMGWVLLSVPAHQQMFGRSDIAAGQSS